MTDIPWRTVCAATGRPTAWLGRLAAALLRPEAAGVALLFLLFTRLSDVFAPTAAPLTMTQLAVALSAFALLYRFVGRREGLVWDRTIGAMLVYGAAIACSIPAAHDPGVTLAALGVYLREVVIVFVLLNVLATPAGPRLAAWTLVAAGALLAAAGGLHAGTGHDLGGLSSMQTGHLAGSQFGARLAGAIGNANNFAQLLVVVAPLALYRAWGERRRVPRLVALGALSLASALIVWTFSRAGLLALFVALGMAVAMQRFRLERLPAIGLAVATAALVAPQPYWDRLGATAGDVAQFALSIPPNHDGDEDTATPVPEDESLRDRSGLWQIGGRMFLEHPLSGVGRGNYYALYPRYAPEVAATLPVGPLGPHNMPVHIAAETGLLGLGAFTAIVILAVLGLRRAKRRAALAGDGRQAMLLEGFEIALYAYLVSSMFFNDDIYQRSLWLLVALAAAGRQVTLRSERGDCSPVTVTPRGLVTGEQSPVSLTSTLWLAGGAALLLWAAVLNGYPFIYFDTGAYVLSSFELWVPPDRPIAYGLFIRLTRIYHSLWLVALVQALVTSYLLLRTAALVLPDGRASRYLAFGALALTAATTGVSEFVGYVMPDLFASWLFLGGFLALASRKPLDRVVGGLVILTAALVHNSHIALGLASSLLLLIAAVLFRPHVPPSFAKGAAQALLLLGLAALLGSALHGVLGAGFTPSRGGPTFLVNRLVASGVINEVLDTYCPRSWSLCDHRALIRSKRGEVDWFLWGSDSPRAEVGWDQGSGEHADLVAHAVRCCLLDIIVSSLDASWAQFWRFKSVADDLPRLEARHAAYQELRDKYGNEFRAFLASDQQSGRGVMLTALPLDEEIPPRAFLVAATGLSAVLVYKRQYRLATMLLAPILYAILNALITGSTGSLASRLQGRVFWLVPHYFWLTIICLGLAGWSYSRRRRTGRWLSLHPKGSGSAAR